MVHEIIALAGAAVLAGSPSSLDLTPIPHRTAVEGGSSADVVFKDGGAQVVYRPPTAWPLSGGGSKLSLKPAAAQSEATIEVRPRPPVVTFDPETIKALKAELVAGLPKGSEKIEWAADEPSPMLLNRHETYRVMFSYSANAQRYTESTLFCNFNQEQVRFQMTAREADFKDLYETFRRSLYTFQGLE